MGIRRWGVALVLCTAALKGQDSGTLTSEKDIAIDCVAYPKCAVVHIVWSRNDGVSTASLTLRNQSDRIIESFSIVATARRDTAGEIAKAAVPFAGIMSAAKFKPLSITPPLTFPELAPGATSMQVFTAAKGPRWRDVTIVIQGPAPETRPARPLISKVDSPESVRTGRSQPEDTTASIPADADPVTIEQGPRERVTSLRFVAQSSD